MKKSKINLIVSREDYQKYENYFLYFRIGVFVLLIFFIIALMVLLITIRNKSEIRSQLTQKKKLILQNLQQKILDEAKINYIEKKYQDLTLFLKDDANSSPYYALLNSAIQQSSESASLKSFSINKNREVNFTISFSDFTQLRDFFKLIESPNFLGNFEKISLKSFSVIGATDIQKENYQLSFIGKFIVLK